MGVVFVLRHRYVYILCYWYECPTLNAAPPLIVDNVLKAIKGVDWRGFGEQLCCYHFVDEVVKGCVSDEARLEVIVKVYLECSLYKSSWRRVIWTLYEANQIELADPRIRSYAEPLEGVLVYSHECMIRSSMILLCL